MKVFSTVLKILTALAAVAGAIYVIAKYGDKITAWAKKLLDGCCCDCQCDCECDCEDCEECECECACECQEAEEAPAEEAPAEEAEPAPVAEEGDFEN